MPETPVSATIFAYQVGFGDCFLLRFNYRGSMKRHVLIDFGTTGLPENAANDQLLQIAKDIADKCGAQLDAVVATHRHADHISGFTTNAHGTGPGDVIRSLKPKVVVQPWTEDPKLAVDAQGPEGSPKAKVQKFAAARALADMHAVSQKLVTMIDRPSNPISKRVAAELRFIGEDNLANISAVKNLASMGRKRVYTYCGGSAGLDAVLPGVKTHVLGPPTLKQTDTISKQRSRDPDEFWQLQARRLTDEAAIANENTPLFPGCVAASGGKLPLNARWVAYRVREASSDQALGLVRALDKQMNNTSLILLFEAHGKKLLFPGDAQIENWRYALDQEAIRKLLEDVDLYKVGHHGSLNATPKSMWNLFKKKGASGKKGRLKSILSTKPGKHGKVSSRTEVPRSTLLAQLKASSDLHNTNDLKEGVLCEVIQIEFR